MCYDSNLLRNVKQKWEQVLNDDINYDTVKNAFKDIVKMKENAYYNYFQFKLLHSRKVTNAKLNTGIMKVSMCRLCLDEIETIKHTFIECTYVKALWNQIELWLRNKNFKSCKISDIDIIFGQRSREKIIDKTIISTTI